MNRMDLLPGYLTVLIGATLIIAGIVMWIVSLVAQ